MIALSVAGAKFLLAGTMHEVSVSVELGAGSYMKQTTANLSHNEMQLGRVVLGMLLQTLALLVRKRSGIQGIRLLQVLTFPGQKQCQPRQAHLSTGTHRLEVAKPRRMQMWPSLSMQTHRSSKQDRFHIVTQLSLQTIG